MPPGTTRLGVPDLPLVEAKLRTYFEQDDAMSDRIAEVSDRIAEASEQDEEMSEQCQSYWMSLALCWGKQQISLIRMMRC